MKIALTYTGSDEKHSNYCNWLKAENEVELETFSADKGNINTLDQCHALVLSGGIDIHPLNYNNSNLNYPNAPNDFNRERDEFEISLLYKALQMKMPVLGICRGMQLINVAMGGSMKQDLGDLNAIHKATDKDKSHRVIIDENSLLYEIIMDREFVANSAHHQAIETVGKDLKIDAYSDEGIPEGIEWNERSGKPFLLGVQWHPERMFKVDLADSPLSVLIRERFIHEVKKSLDR